MADATLTPTPDHAPRAAPGVAGFVLAVIVFLVTTTLVLYAWHEARENTLRSAEAEFDASTEEIVELLQQRLVNYELTIRGGAALFASVARPSPSEWRAYVDGLNIAQRFPAMTGLGYAAFVSRYQMQRLQEDQRAAGRGLLTIWPHGARERYGPILYLEPHTAENLSAIGYDMYSEPARHAAMQAAMNDALPRMSSRVKLLQDLDPNASGFLLYAPVFPGGVAPATTTLRAAAITGWVYAPIRAKRFVEVAIAPIKRTVTFRLYDVTDHQPVLVYADANYREGDSAAFHDTRTIRAYGRQWKFEFASGSRDDAAPGLVPLRTALIVGLLASLLLFGVVWSLAHTEMRAQRLAARMSLAARRSESRVRALNRSLEARVETRTREVSEANRELESFAYSVSHDLRAPLRAIEGFSRVLEDRNAAALDDTGRDYLARVRNAAARMSELIEGLLKLSRVARRDLVPARLALSPMASEIIADLRTTEPDRHIIVDIAPTLIATADRAMVRSLLLNLLGNAWKFTRDREDARIVFAQADDDATFYVQDNGAGFDPTYVDKLFRPFQRLHDGAEFAGEGIGLATVKRIVERHGGEITATGAPGQGALFSFTLRAKT